VTVDATRLITKTGSSMTAEYDVPVEMWFYRDNPYPFSPYSMLMEMALQPCGFLSAFMGPTLAYPDIDFYFRNLDGQGKLLREVDLRGRTLVNKVVLLSSTVLQGIIIQKYSFDMQLDGESFYVGSSTFGYFTLQALSSQAGLDMGKPPQKWHEANPSAPLIAQAGNRSGGMISDSWMSLPDGQLAFVDDLKISADGGKHGKGYIYATNLVTPSQWYFRCHFHDDPVMPGSLGLETISQAIQAFALHTHLHAGMTTPHFANADHHEMVWKYRGQVLGDSDSVNVEISIADIVRDADGVTIIADASLWKGALRIYEFKHVTVRLTDGI
jgi:3-hydroxymyristoyl/3-hydroxydecanoyl-(acyl carrier protein) dehydratase